jgi:uncharacterized protein (TIGR00269 family)
MACKCGNSEIYFTRKYEGTIMCKKCFVRSIEKKVKRIIRINKLLEHGDNIGVALSGGKDSTTALYIINQIVCKRKDMTIFAISIDEGTGKYRTDTIKKSAKLCKSLGIPHYIYSFENELGGKLPDLMKKNPRLNACTFCGVLRRDLLNRKARELGATKLAFGFNLNDEAESVFMNFVFGNLDKFLRLGPLVSNRKIELFIPRLKPLREVPEEELFAYCDALNLPYYGKKKCPYGKESVRKTIRKYLYDLDEKYPGTLFQIVKFADVIIPPLKEHFQKTGEIKHCIVCGEPSSQDVCKACELMEKGEN